MSDISVTFSYSKGVAKSLKHKVKQEIIDSFESSPELKKEIARTFQTANRRIQNIEKSGVLSPAVASLDVDGEGFSKFRVGGKSWETLKKDYAKAISFLQQPTSTATGAKQFEKQLQARSGVQDDELFEPLKEKLVEKYASLSGSLLNALPYYAFMQDIYETTAIQVGNMIEAESVATANALQKAIDTEAERGAQEYVDILEEWENTFKW